MYNFGTIATIHGVEYMILSVLQDGYALAVRTPIIAEATVMVISLPTDEV